jgi:hypothetical protein
MRASEGDKDDADDWDSRWKWCLLSFITSAQSSFSPLSGVPMKGLSVEFLGLWPYVNLVEFNNSGFGPDLGVEGGGERAEKRDLVLSVKLAVL